MINVFIYGSLKKGFFNHSLIEEYPKNKFIRKGFVEGYELYLLWSYPGIKPSSQNDKLYVELYSLTDEVFEVIDRMERLAGYTPTEVEDDEGNKGVIYVYDREVNKDNIISSGNWTKNDEKLKIIEEVSDNGR